MAIGLRYRCRNDRQRGGLFHHRGHILNHIRQLSDQVKNYKPSRRGNRKIKRDRVTNYAAAFGATNASLEKALVHPELDIGVGKLNGYVTPAGHAFPKFRTREVEVGELLCRIGFPFLDDKQPDWDQKKNIFSLTNLFPVPLFVNEAFVSRYAALPSGVWIETSSPGLKGQSGGPLADSDGYICGLQVNTHHYPLGFEGKGRNQVLNVGRAVHVKSIRNFLDKEKISYFTEDT